MRPPSPHFTRQMMLVALLIVGLLFIVALNRFGFGELPACDGAAFWLYPHCPGWVMLHN